MPTVEQIASEHPDIAAAFIAQGASAERARIQGVEAQLIPGHEALIDTLKFDGKSQPGDAAMAVNAAEKNQRTAQAKALASDAPAPLKSSAATTVEQAAKPAATVTHRVPAGFAVSESGARLDADAKRYQAQHPGTDYISAVKAIQQGA